MKSLRRSFLTLLLLVVAQSGHAVELVPDQAGDVLLLPFFTTQAGWDSYLNVSTPEHQGGAHTVVFKVRFIDGLSGEVTNSFNAYPEPLYLWNISLTRSGEGSLLRLAEGSCLIDESLNTLVTGETVEIAPQVGMIEIYRLGVLRNRITPSLGTGAARCQNIAARWETDGVWDENPQTDISDAPPTADNRLIGDLYLVNVESGAAATYDALPLIDVVSDTPHTPPWDDVPNLAQARPVAVINGEEIEPVSGEGIDAVALAITQGKRDLINDVIVADTINASTDWVLSYPIDPYKSYRPFSSSDGSEVLTCDTFGRRLPPPGVPTAEVPEDRVAGIMTFGQGTNNSPQLDIDPVALIPEELALCHAINIVPFGDAPSILVDESSDHLASQPDPFKPPLGESPVTVRWRPYPEIFPEESGITRPVFGFRLTRFENGVLDGGTVLRNYTVLREHRRH